jgi:hypothetical protein
MSKTCDKRSKIVILITIISFSALFSSEFSSPSMGQNSDVLTNSQSNVILLSISNISITKSATGLTSVTGTVLNNSTENVMTIKIDVTLYDANNITIKETSRFISGPFTGYEPGSVQRFSFLMSTEDFDHYTARAYAEPARTIT